MIPHHQNAVNMAKTTLLYVGSSLTVECEDDANKRCPDTESTDLLRDIIQNQNAQIQYMRDYLGTIQGALAEPVLCSASKTPAPTTTPAPTPAPTTTPAPTPAPTTPPAPTPAPTTTPAPTPA